MIWVAAMMINIVGLMMILTMMVKVVKEIQEEQLLDRVEAAGETIMYGITIIIVMISKMVRL